MIDVREIKLNMRYPESRQEDITDAFMRGYTGAVEIGNKAIEKLESENAKLRELVRDMWFWHYEGHIDSESQECQMKHIDGVIQRMRDLGVEVDG